MLTLWYSEGVGTSRYRVPRGTLAECERYIQRHDSTWAQWEVEDEEAG